MGVVFSLEQFHRGRIPTRDDYVRANDIAREGLEKLHLHGSLTGAVFNGSTGNGSARPGSDIDIVAVVPSFDDVRILEELVDDIEHETCVPVEIVPEIAHLAQSGVHGIDYFFAQYLASQPLERVIGVNPTTYFAPLPSWSNPRDERIKELGEKVRKMNKNIVNTRRWDDRRCHMLQQTLSWPVVAALDRIRVNDNKNPLDENGQLPSKERIRDIYSERYGYAYALDRAISTTTIYRQLLEGNSGPDDYENMLKIVDNFAAESTAFLIDVRNALIEGK